MDPKKFLEFVKRAEEVRHQKEQSSESDDAYRETFLNENNILDFLKIAEKEAKMRDLQTGKINYLELYNEYEDRQIALFRKDRLNPSKGKKKRKSPLA